MTINGTNCQGSLRALNPATGAFLWEDCLTSGHVLGAFTAVPGVAVVGAGPDIYVFPTASQANLLFTATGSGGANFYGAASISNGVMYIGDTNGNLYAFAP